MIENQEEISIECAILQGKNAYLNGDDIDSYKGEYKDEFEAGYREEMIKDR